MKRLNVIFLWVGIFCLSVLMGAANAADKFGYIDVMRTATEYNKAKSYNKKLEDKKASYQVDVDKKANEIKQVEDKYNLMSDKEKEAKKADLQEKYKGFENFVQQKQVDLRKQDLENTKEVVDDIKKAITDYAQKKSYTMVFDQRVLLLENKGMDITEDIIKNLNNGYKG